MNTTEQKEKVEMDIVATNLQELNSIVENIRIQASELQKAISQLANFELEISVKNQY